MKPKILIANKFYYPRGGDCICAMNLERLLGEHGHDTAVYAMRYDSNVSSPWERYFAPEVKFSGSVSSRFAALSRLMGGGVADSFGRLLHDFRPDIVHLHNIHSYLSPKLAQMAHNHGAAVVWTMHDYKLVCPSYSCLANGQVCRDCQIDSTAVLRKRCMKGSMSASALAWLEALRWQHSMLCDWVDSFIAPSHFMAEMLCSAGFPNEKVATLCNFVDPDKLATIHANGDTPRGDYYCYVGRLSAEKGVDTLLEAASRLDFPLRVAGTGPEEARLRDKYGSHPAIEFLGHCDADSVAQLLLGARFMVIPSRWYENNPLSVIESLSAGTPVLGANIGGIPELIFPGAGMTFPHGDPDAMAGAIAQMYAKPFDRDSIKEEAARRFSFDTHYSLLTEIYEKALAAHKS